MLCAVIAATCVAFAACDGDDGDDATPTVSPPVSAAASATTAPGATPTVPETPAITIDEPASGSTVAVPFQATGTANVFEAALVVELLDEDRTLLCRHFIQATSGTGTRGTWETTMAVPPPDAPTAVTLRALDYSARDGSEENVVERELTLSAEAPAIVIEEPACASSFSTSDNVIVSGVAEVFEAALTVQLQRPDGTAALSENVTALSGVERSAWNTTFDLSDPAVQPGAYTIVALSYSAETGAAENEFAVPIAVTP
jgi:hypothetical protein